MIVSTEAVVLSSIKYGDTSKIFTCYTKDFGKINLIAKGSRQTKSKVGSALEPLSHSFLSFYKKPTKDLYLLSKVELIKNYKLIFTELEKIAVGLAILESIKKTQEVNIPNQKLFDMVLFLLDKLNTKNVNYNAVLIYYHIKLAEMIGISLNISELNIEKYKQYDKFNISIEDASLIKKNDNKKYYILDKKDIILLKELSNFKDDMHFPAVDDEQTKRIMNFFYLYFSYHLEMKYFLNSINIYLL